MSGIPRLFVEMVKGDDVNHVASRLAGYLKVVKEREGGQEALESLKISLRRD
jgi:hypothetical protein